MGKLQGKVKTTIFPQAFLTEPFAIVVLLSINTLVKDVKEKLHVFDENGLYLATNKIGKNNPKAEQIQTDNGYRMRWNREVDRAIVSGVAETEIQQIKKEYISDRIKESIDVFGNQPERFGTILMSAVDGRKTIAHSW